MKKYDDDAIFAIGFHGIPTIKEATAHPCSDCGKQVWISPSTMNAVLDCHLQHGGKVHFICLECVPKEGIDEAMITSFSKGQFDELKTVLKKEHGIDMGEICHDLNLTEEEVHKRLSNAISHIVKDLQHAAKTKTIPQILKDMLEEKRDQLKMMINAGPSVWTSELMILRELAEHVGGQLKPDEDWSPVIFIDGIVPPDMPGDLLVGTRSKTEDSQGLIIIPANWMMAKSMGELTEMMAILAYKTKARGMTFASTAWCLEVEPEIIGKPLPVPSESPDRKERFMMISTYNNGEADGTKLAMADIKRSPDKAPELCNWKLQDDDYRYNFLGRIPRAIKTAMELVKEGE